MTLETHDARITFATWCSLQCKLKPVNKGLLMPTRDRIVTRGPKNAPISEAVVLASCHSDVCSFVRQMKQGVSNVWGSNDPGFSRRCSIIITFSETSRRFRLNDDQGQARFVVQGQLESYSTHCVSASPTSTRSRTRQKQFTKLISLS